MFQVTLDTDSTAIVNITTDLSVEQILNRYINQMQHDDAISGWDTTSDGFRIYLDFSLSIDEDDNDDYQTMMNDAIKAVIAYYKLTILDNEFIEYVLAFYSKDGLYDMGLTEEDAIKCYKHRLDNDYAHICGYTEWPQFDGDSADRENIRALAETIYGYEEFDDV